MKVLQVNSVYKKGSTGKIVYDLHKGLQENGIESVVCYGRGKNFSEDNVYKVCGEMYSHLNHIINNITGLMYGNFYFSTRKLISIIKKEKPDIVHLQCINGYFVNIVKLVEWLKNNKIKTIITLHAEFMYTGGCGHAFECNKWKINNKLGCTKCPQWRGETKSYFLDNTNIIWKRLKRAFKNFNDNLTIVSVSPWLMNRAKDSSILFDKKHVVILNGLDTKIFHRADKANVKNLKHELGIRGEKVIFHVTPFFNNDANHIKGGYYVIELAKRMPNVIFVIAGNYKEKLKTPDNIILLGNISDQKKLAELYSMADVTVLTSKKETFSMVTAESLSCGTPIVGFKAGAPEMIALKEYSKFVEYGDINALKCAINEFLNKGINSSDFILKRNIYSKEHMINDYIKLYKDNCVDN